MAISIKNPRAEELVKELVGETGESYTEAIIRALDERLARVRGRRRVKYVREAVQALCLQCRALPDLDARTPDEILGYGETGGF
jgi:antitoxin VapB